MSNLKKPGVLLTAGVATFVAYVLTHPRGAERTPETVREMVHSMAIEPAWEVSHAIGLLAFLLIGVGMWALLRAGAWADDKLVRRAAGLVVVGSFVAAVELIPHALVGLETGEILTGGSAPFTDLHLLLQALFLPVYAAGIAGLAVTGFGRVAHPIACVLGVIGGVALALVGPLLLVTDEAALGRMFMAGSGTVLFLLAVGIRAIRNPADPARAHVAVGATASS